MITSAACYILISSIFCLSEVKAEDFFRTYNTARFTLHIGSSPHKAPLRDVASIEKLAQGSLKVLNSTHEELVRIFNYQPKQRVVLRLLTPRDFRLETGAPSWTSAMYFRGQISVPLTAAAKNNPQELYRALRHEYVHAFIADLSDHKCPAWLDEGVAQIIEGRPNPLLGPALREWIKDNKAMPLSWLKNGFTTLNSEIVPAAYAESLLISRTLINRHGFKSVKKYLQSIKQGKNNEQAFASAFGVAQDKFELSLTAHIKRWAGSSQRNP